MRTRITPASPVLLLLLLLCGLPLAGCGGAGSGVEPPHEVALEGIDPEISARIGEALAAARSAPDDAGRRTDLGMAYEVGGLPNAAARCYRAATLLDPAEPRHHYYLALVRGNAGDLDGALAEVDIVIALDGRYLPAQLYRGSWLLDAGRVEEARATFQRATSVDSKSHAAWIGLARSHLHADRPDQAVKILETVVREYPHPQVFQLLGLAYRGAGDLESARLALARGKPGPPPGWPDPWNARKGSWLAGFGAGLQRAEALLSRGKPQEAIQLLEHLRRTHPDDVALLNNLSVAYSQAGDPDQSFAVLLDALERNPNYFPFHLNVSSRHAERGDLERALYHLDVAIRLNPTSAWAYQQKGGYLEQAGRYREALEAYDVALSYDASAARYFVAAANLEERLGNRNRAILRLEEALQVDPSQAQVRERLARLKGS